jgi:hypothetical protein
MSLCGAALVVAGFGMLGWQGWEESRTEAAGEYTQDHREEIEA